MAELLVEIFSEEIPARMQARAAADLKRLVTEGLKAANLSFDSAEAYATPRRLVLVVDGLPAQQPDLTEEKKGPKYGAPAKAVQGFMKANGLKSIEEAELRATEKGDFYFVVRHIAGRAAAEVLPEILTKAFGDLPWPKSMRWAGDTQRWVRPLHGIVAVFDGKALSGGLTMGEGRVVPFGSATQGHRFLAPEPFEVIGFEDYRTKLRNAKVMLDPAERREVIAGEIAEFVTAEGLRVKDDPALLDEVAGLVEWPQVVMGRIDEDFMDLPGEVLSTSMRSHQKYFSTEKPDGSLADRFLLVANMEAPEGTERAKTIVAGNERVLRARLADARFFWDQDCQNPLSSRVPALKDIVFHAKLGTVADKVSRLESLAAEISKFVPGADRDEARSAARLAKADLTAGMVGEFPELQGVMGRYYALNDGETPAVAEAVAEHYQPLGPNDACPSAPISICVALADKIDTLAGFWAIDEKPTGSKDPYALRRAALGVIRLVVENKLRLKLNTIFMKAIESYPEELRRFDPKSKSLSVAAGTTLYSDKNAQHVGSWQLAAVLLDFIADRLKVALRDQGIRHDLISAVFEATQSETVEEFGVAGEVDLVRLLDRVDALSEFLKTDDGGNLLIAYRRAANIVRIESQKKDFDLALPVDEDRFDQAEESQLYASLRAAQTDIVLALKNEEFSMAMSAMARLRQPVDAFFDKVTVNAEDEALRENRLRLLDNIKATLEQVADFSKIEG